VGTYNSPSSIAPIFIEYRGNPTVNGTLPCTGTEMCAFSPALAQMMTSVYSLQLPALSFSKPTGFPAAGRYQTAISITLSISDTEIT